MCLVRFGFLVWFGYNIYFKNELTDYRTESKQKPNFFETLPTESNRTN